MEKVKNYRESDNVLVESLTNENYRDRETDTLYRRRGEIETVKAQANAVLTVLGFDPIAASIYTAANVSLMKIDTILQTRGEIGHE